LWRAGGDVVCRSCYGRSIQRELRRNTRSGQLRMVAIAILVVALIVAVAVLGPRARDRAHPSPSECITRPEAC
jgi:hypothetical protein